MVQGETSVIVILNFNGVYLPFWFSVSQMIWILLHDLWKSSRRGIIKRLRCTHRAFFAPGCTHFAPKCTQCKTKALMQNESRGLYHFLSHSTPLDSNFDTKLESSFLFILANSALKTACQAAFLQLEHESHPLLQNATCSLCGPNVAFSVFRAVI